MLIAIFVGSARIAAVYGVVVPWVMGHPQSACYPLLGREMPMNDGKSTEWQLHLFQIQLAWDEFPREVRQHTTHLLAMLCVEAAAEHPQTQDQSNEPRTNSPVAP